MNMFEILYVNGCSWASGNELQDDNKFDEFLFSKNLKKRECDAHIVEDLNGNYHSAVTDFYDELNWGSYVYSHFKFDKYINESIGGSSNNRILRKTLNFVNSLSKNKYEKTFIIIAWTYPDRNEVYLKNFDTYERFNTNIKFSDSVDNPYRFQKNFLRDMNLFQSIYMDNILSEKAYLKEYIHQIILLGAYLNQIGIKHLFYNSLFSLHDYLLSNKDYMNTFQNDLNILQSVNCFYSDITHSHFNYINGFMVGKYLHPLIEGHNAWGNHLVDVINSKKLLYG